MTEFDYSSLDARSLQVFTAVLEHGSVSRAAVQLGTSQSAVSHTLDKLRRIFDDPLFVKAGRGIAPTAYARSLGPRVRGVLDELRALSAGPDFTPETAELTFTVAANDYQRDLLLPPLRAELEHAAPGIRLRVIPSGVPSAELLRSQVCDLVLTPHPPSGDDIVQRRLFEDRSVCFYDPAVREAPQTLDDYLAARHISIAFGAGEQLAIDTALDARGVARNVVVSVANFSGIAPFLQGTDLLATVPAGMAKTGLRGFAYCPPPVPQDPIRMFMAWHRRNHDAPAHGWLRDKLRRLAEGIDVPV